MASTPTADRTPDRTRRFSPCDEEKPVRTEDGVRVGTVKRVQNGTAHVDPRPGLFDGRGSFLWHSWQPDRPLPLEPRAVERIDEHEVVLKRGAARTVTGEGWRPDTLDG